jgi:cytoskeletal protein RodZ
MPSLGETLKERRRSLGLSVNQIESATRIRARFLTALEEGVYDQLPDPGYVRGYVSTYARFLELDPIPLLAMYKAESGARPRKEFDLPQVGEAVARTGEQHAIPLRAAALVIISLLVLALGILGITRVTRGPEDPPPMPLPADDTQNETDSVQPEAVIPQQPEGSSAPAQGLPFTIDVAVASDSASWLRVTIDGRVAYEGTLTGGQSKRFEVSEEASVRIGKPSAVTVLRDGKKQKLPSGDTPVLTLTTDTED